MKRILFIASLFGATFAFSQSDGCSSATSISVTANCSSPTVGSTSGLTQTIAGCTGTADDDGWYQFVATGTGVQVVVTPDGGFDPVVQLFEGGCGTLVSLSCTDNGLTGDVETLNYTGLTPGNTYRIRVYHYYSGSGSGNFTICVTNPPPAPSNDACANATPLTVSSSCTPTTGTTDGATPSAAGCSGNADDDVWYSFVATNSVQTVTVDPIDNLDLVFQVYSGSCGSLNSLACQDATFTNEIETKDLVGLVPGQTYFIRVYDYYSGQTGDFDICITGTPTATPINDEPCNAIAITDVTSACEYAQFTTVGATTTVTPGAPSSCVGGSGAAIGGYQSGTADVWFAITVPSSGNLVITPQPNGGGGSISDGVMVLYTGSCGSLSQVICSDDNNYPGTGNDYLPFINESGLTPGSTVYLRYFGFGTSSGTFGLCFSTATNDECANALYICDINGYKASTSEAFTPDRPDGLRGNNEDINGANLPDGTNSGGLFGSGDPWVPSAPWGSGSPNLDVVIDNNSWIKFTASNTTAILDVDVYDCFTSAGIQMQIFEGTDCADWTPVSNYEESATAFSITANNLTVGQDYYLMVDGFAGDICSYTITANSGVQFPDIADVPALCDGDMVTLTAPPGATSYDWQHDGSSGQTVNVTPSTTQTYYCEVTGLCDYKQLLDVTVTVNGNPNVQITNGATDEVCNGSSLNISATGATSYVWSTTQTGSSINVSPTSNTTYSVTGTDGNGCEATDQIDITVNALPTLAVNPTAVDASCGGNDGELNGALPSGTPSFTYSWTNGSGVVGTSPNLTGVPAGSYFLTVTDGNTCSDQFGPFSISNPGAPPAPSIIVDDNTPCLDADVQLTATNSVGGVTYNWTGPNGFTSNSAIIVISNITNLEEGSYCVSSTISGCTGPSTCEAIDVQPEPNINITATDNDSTICLGNDFELIASGANSYSWSGPNGFGSTSNPINVSNVTILNEGYYVVQGTDGSGCVGVDSMMIDVLDLPTLTLTADQASATYCNSTIATINGSGASTYQWTGPNGYSSTSTNAIILNLSAASQGYYVLSGTDSEGCISSDSIYLTVITDVPVAMTPDTMVCPGETIALWGEGGNSFTWSGPLGFSSSDQNPTVTTDAAFDHTGQYYLTVVDDNGCIGTASSFIEVSNSGDCLFIPNLVTPNKDFHNDYWEIYGIEKYEDAEVEIYNRWGNLVYSASPYNNDWDGRVNEGAVVVGNEGKVPVGTYFYIIRLNDGDKPPYKGYVEVQY